MKNDKKDNTKTQEQLDHEMKCVLSRVTSQCASLSKLTDQFTCLLNTLKFKQDNKK